MPIGLVYDPGFLAHETGNHPENAGRLRAVTTLLTEQGIWGSMIHLAAESVAPEALEVVHDPTYIRSVKRIAASGGGWLTQDTVVSARSYDVACRAAGAAVRAVDAVVRREVDSAFALVRPPGHHARPAAGMGFCLFNNAAVAARDAVRRLGLERVLLLDFDVHHGNGTQEIFYDDPSVFYVSTHQYPAYPGTGALEETGVGPGLGFTANLPLPAGVGDEEYIRAFDELLAPLVYRYRPDLILASAGYDAHWTNGAYLSSIEMRVTVTGFGQIVARLRDWAGELCGGRLALVLEGGYHPEALAWSVLGTLRVLRGEPVQDPIGPPLARLWERFRETHGLS